MASLTGTSTPVTGVRSEVALSKSVGVQNTFSASNEPNQNPSNTDVFANSFSQPIAHPDMPDLTSRNPSAALFPAEVNTSLLTPVTPMHTARDSFDPSDSSSFSSSDDDNDNTESTTKRQDIFTKVTAATKSTVDKLFSSFSVDNEYFKTRGKVSKTDGRLKLSVHENGNSGYLAKALGTTVQHHLGPNVSEHTDSALGRSAPAIRSVSSPGAQLDTRKTRSPASECEAPIPKLNIVIMVIGSRGDIQPFIKLGNILKNEHGHRVRIASHPAFRDFVEKECGLEFFSVGGDPSELMAFMVKNPGLIPSISTVANGEIGRRRDAMFDMFQGFWRACINTTDEEHNPANLRMLNDNRPFVADAIIANPPSFAHVHCAERLGIPLHMMFTFPYSPTQQFPHPLANIQKSNVDASYTNFMSYPLVDMMTWQGLGDLINRFRVESLGLDPVSTLWAPGQLWRLKVPTTYMWSPGLVPKPADWGAEIDVAGFVFLELASSFEPPESLAKFLEAGSPPIYIGFGSIVVDDPDNFTKMIFEAVKKAGVRALVSKGWGGLGNDDIPDSVYMLENTPHDWLFPKVSAVVHHGGAGTTAIGLKCGKPTMIVPFFGDQPFWSRMVSQAGAGAKDSIRYKDLTAEKLAQGIKECLSKPAQEAAQGIAESIAKEGDGARNAVDCFHRNLPLSGEDSIRCSILKDRHAVWKTNVGEVHLSALAADILVESKVVQWSDLSLLKHCSWSDFQGPGEPVTGAGGAVVNSARTAATGIFGIPTKVRQGLKNRRELKVKKRQQRRKIIAGDKYGASEATLASKNAQQRDKNHDSAVELSDQDAQDEKLSLAPPMNLFSSPESDRPQIGDRMSSVQVPSLPAVVAKGTGHGIVSGSKAVGKAPLDVMLAITLGFHNAPRLYGDTTVRPAPVKEIKGVKSGLKTAGKEFGTELYDAGAGVIKHPYKDYKAHGLAGCVTGVGKGLGGLILKPIAAVLGLGAYTGKGVRMELKNAVGHTDESERWIRRSRIEEGAQDYRKLIAERERGVRSTDRRSLHRSQTDGAALEPQDSDGARDSPGTDLSDVKARVKQSWKAIERAQVEDKAPRERRHGPFHRRRSIAEGDNGPRRSGLSSSANGNSKSPATKPRRASTADEEQLRERQMWQDYKETERRLRVLDRYAAA